MSDILTDLRRTVDRNPDTLMLSPPLRTEQVRELLVIVASLESDKRRLARIADELSAQNTALNQMLQNVVEAEEWEREMTKPVSAEVWADMKRRIANWGKGAKVRE